MAGYAWSENMGWIVFNCQDLEVCPNSDFKVKTTWLSMVARKDRSVDVGNYNFACYCRIGRRIFRDKIL